MQQIVTLPHSTAQQENNRHEARTWPNRHLVT